MKKPTEKQTELLLRIAPKPLGYDMRINEAVESLGISKFAAYRRLQTFKKNFPGAWENFKSLRKVRKRHRFALRWKRTKNQKKYLRTFTDLAGDNDVDEFLDMLENKGAIKGLL